MRVCSDLALFAFAMLVALGIGGVPWDLLNRQTGAPMLSVAAGM